MSTFNTSDIESTSGGAPSFSQGLTVGGTDITSLVAMTEYYDQASEPGSPADGAVWWDGTDVRQYIGDQWIIVSVTAPTLYLGPTAVLRTDVSSADFPQSNQQTYNITTASNASNFGALTDTIKHSAGAASNRAIGVYLGGSKSVNTGSGTSTTTIDTIEYYTFSSLSNATDFGGVATQSKNEAGGMSDGTYGVFGPYDGFFTNSIEYITFNTPANAVNFGNVTVSRRYGAAFSDGSRGVMAGGQFFTPENTIDYITIATPGNATDFGDLAEVKSYVAGCSDTTRGLVAGGRNGSSVTLNVIEYVTIQTTGNAVDFGDLTAARFWLSACADETRATFVGGSGSNVIDYVTIQTTGNAVDFGDLTTASAAKGGATSGG